MWVNQKNLSNIHIVWRKICFKRIIFVPYLDDFISSLNDSFMSNKETITIFFLLVKVNVKL